MTKHTTTNINRDIHGEAVRICDATNQKLYGYVNDAVATKNEREEKKLSKIKKPKRSTV